MQCRSKPLSVNTSEKKIVTLEVIDHICDVICHCDKPSWLSSVPQNFGDASAGTLKADEWKIMCTVYLLIALVTLWGAGSSHATPEIGVFSITPCS